ncbi:MAG: hypothetical protein OYG32_13945 [Rhodospirillaceae bacterium]|nr:hypothetical protein [Rhodospirillaceae bacterium]MDE0255890.1 hypothetical protein [Rhodospirillaceae bacterium]MDE0619871.1 hypothetical protein [Rhodospirillaceae bacterium]
MPAASESANERVYRSRERRRQAGLKRVEVYVPADRVDTLKAYAAQLREGSQPEAVREARKLIATAYRRFRVRCLDNIDVDPETADLPDAAVIAAALMHRGNAEAYRLGQKLSRLAR